MLKGFGMAMDLKRGTTRHWFVGADGVQRWADNNAPCESAESLKLRAIEAVEFARAARAKAEAARYGKR